MTRGVNEGSVKKNVLVRHFVLVAVLLCRCLAGGAQQRPTLPMVSFAEVPLYPPLARTANIAGIVHVVVTTDGHRVVATQVKDGEKVLSAAAEKNAKSWQFATHEPTTFTVTYVYKLVDNLNPQRNNPRVILQLPTDVEVDAERWPGTRDASPTSRSQK